MLNIWDKYGNLRYKGLNILEEKNKSYYHIEIERDRLFGGNSSEKCYKECYEFIKRHFEEGKKGAVMDVFFRNDKENKELFLHSIRTTHTVSLYLLGLSMHEIFEDELKNYLKKFIKNLKKWYDFRYTWFLTCLYHDTVSCEEAAKHNLGDLKEGLEYTIYNHILTNGENYKPYFTQELINNYWKYRKHRDHGIGAGYYFFNSLCNNFYEKTKGKLTALEEKTIDGLSWRREHLDHFAYIADAIICHNIWYVDEEKRIEEYKENNLNKLIITSKEDRKRLKQNPLYFMLCLLDTIEPTKRFEGLDIEYVLKNVFIEGMGEKIIRIKWNKEFQKENKEKFNVWKTNIQDLEKWLGVTVKELDNMMDIKILS